MCSFKTTMSEEQFLSVWGTSHRWDELDQEFGIHETRGKFALLYWGAVRDVAVRSPTACKSIFQLPMSIIERLASSSTMELIEFCFSDFNLQRFRLTFPEADCWAIWTALTSKTVPVIQRLRLAHAKFAKTMHAQSEGLPTGYLDTIKEDLL